MTYGESGRRPRVIVTGATQGIGRTIARAVALFDVELILADSDGQSLSFLADDLSAHGMFCDPHSLASVEIFEAQYRQKFDSLHLLVNAADEGHERILSTIRMSVACLPILRKTLGAGAILNVAESGLSRLATPFRYTSSPEATACYSAHLQRLLKGTSVTVATISASGAEAVDAVCDLIEPTVQAILSGHVPTIPVTRPGLAEAPRFFRHDEPPSGLNDEALPLRNRQ